MFARLLGRMVTQPRVCTVVASEAFCAYQRPATLIIRIKNVHKLLNITPLYEFVFIF